MKIPIPGVGPLKVLNRAPRGQSSSTTSTQPTVTAQQLGETLRKSIQLLYVDHVSADGVNYQAMKQSSAYSTFKQNTQLLRKIDITPVLTDDAHKIAFFVNLYNAGMQDAIISVGKPAASSVLRLAYYMGVGYNIGGLVFSFHDIENGILRANRKVSVTPKPFRDNDQRRRFCVDKLDPRIHFVLNCAAGSCPPILFLTPDNLDESLDIATKGFLANERNVSVTESTVFLSKIFDWYRGDFSNDGGEKGLLEFVVENGDENNEQIKLVKNLVENGMDRVKVKWKDYDWSLNEA